MLYRRLRVRLETEHHVIQGTLQLPSEGYRSRVTDYLNAHHSDFLPITEAQLAWHGESREPEAHEYLAVSVRHVVLVAELEFLGTYDEAGEPPARPLAALSAPPPRAA